MADSPETPPQPAKQAVSPISGTAPPIEHRFKPGQSGNPRGRPAVGASIEEWMNVLGSANDGEGLTERSLRAISKDHRVGSNKRTAAQRLLRMMECGDLADMQGLCDGSQTLAELRESGVNTEVVKKVKTRTRSLMENGETVGVEVEREVELHDRSGDEFDRVMDRTKGRPRQEIVQHVDGAIRTIPEGSDQAATLLDSIRRRFAADNG